MTKTFAILLTALCRLGFVIIGLPVLWVREFTSPVRLGELLEDRIGHLACNTELYLRLRRDSQRISSFRPIFVAWNPANRPLLKIWKRHIPIAENKLARCFFIACRPLIERTRFHEPMPTIPVIEHEAFLGRHPAIRLSEEEEALGRDRLCEMGIGPADWFVCFHARDPIYLATREGFGRAEYRSSYLDCSIDNYIKAMRWIAEQGGFAVRMGSAVEKELPDLGPRIIDYATRHRDPFMDVYLGARCKFFLGNNSGLFGVARIFNVPWALANLCPYPWVGKAGWRNMDIPKLLRRTSDGYIFSFFELAEVGLLECYRDDMPRLRHLFKPETYEQLGYEWIENDPDDILALCMDMYDQIAGKPLDPEGLRLRDAFNRLYPKGYEKLPGGGISPRFALRHRDLIEPPSSVALPARARLAAGTSLS